MWFDTEFDRLFRRWSDRFFDEDDFFEPTGRVQTFGPYYYGYTMTIGPDGKPHIREYGNIRPQLTQVGDVREPFVDDIIDKESKTLKLVAEMPGVDKKDIQVTVEDKTAHIFAEHGERKYNARVPLKYKVDEDSAKASYQNGILEVTFNLKDETPKGKKINIE